MGQNCWSPEIITVHPGRLTWNLQITHLDRKMIWTKPPGNYVPAVNLPGCKGFERCPFVDMNRRPPNRSPSRLGPFFLSRKESLASRVTLKSAKPPEGSATPEPEKEEEDEFVGIFVGGHVSGIFFSLRHSVSLTQPIAPNFCGTAGVIILPTQTRH